MAHQLPAQLMTTCSEGFFYCFGQWAFNVTLGWFWTFALMAFSVAIFMATSRLGTTRAFGFASFVGMLGSVWFATLNFMPWWIASIFILTGVIGLATMIMSER